MKGVGSVLPRWFINIIVKCYHCSLLNQDLNKMMKLALKDDKSSEWIADVKLEINKLHLREYAVSRFQLIHARQKVFMWHPTHYRIPAISLLSATPYHITPGSITFL